MLNSSGEAWEAACVTGKFTIKFKDEAHATAFRKRMYRARARLADRLRAEHEKLQAQGKLPSDMPPPRSEWEDYMVKQDGSVLTVVLATEGFGIIGVK